MQSAGGGRHLSPSSPENSLGPRGVLCPLETPARHLVSPQDCRILHHHPSRMTAPSLGPIHGDTGLPHLPGQLGTKPDPDIILAGAWRGVLGGQGRTSPTHYSGLGRRTQTTNRPWHGLAGERERASGDICAAFTSAPLLNLLPAPGAFRMGVCPLGGCLEGLWGSPKAPCLHLHIRLVPSSLLFPSSSFGLTLPPLAGGLAHAHLWPPASREARPPPSSGDHQVLGPSAEGLWALASVCWSSGLGTGGGPEDRIPRAPTMACAGRRLGGSHLLLLPSGPRGSLGGGTVVTSVLKMR